MHRPYLSHTVLRCQKQPSTCCGIYCEIQCHSQQSWSSLPRWTFWCIELTSCLTLGPKCLFEEVDQPTPQHTHTSQWPESQCRYFVGCHSGHAASTTAWAISSADKNETAWTNGNGACGSNALLRCIYPHPHWRASSGALTFGLVGPESGLGTRLGIHKLYLTTPSGGEQQHGAHKTKTAVLRRPITSNITNKKEHTNITFFRPFLSRFRWFDCCICPMPVLWALSTLVILSWHFVLLQSKGFRFHFFSFTYVVASFLLWSFFSCYQQQTGHSSSSSADSLQLICRGRFECLVFVVFIEKPIKIGLPNNTDTEDWRLSHSLAGLARQRVSSTNNIHTATGITVQRIQSHRFEFLNNGKRQPFFCLCYSSLEFLLKMVEWCIQKH